MLLCIVVLIFLTSNAVVHGQNIVAVAPLQMALGSDRQDYLLDISGLGGGTEFYDSDELDIQLSPEEPTLIFHRLRGSSADNQHFNGETEDSRYTCSLLRYLVEGDDKAEILVGLVQDVKEGVSYQLKTTVSGEVVSEAVLNSDLPREEGPNEAEESVSGENGYEVTADIPEENPLPVAGTDIDILVVWTRDAECDFAGLAVGCAVTARTQAMIQSEIAFFIAEMNDAYSNSLIDLEVKLVHSYRDESGYTESGNPLDALNDITGVGDGKLDEVHSTRAAYGADAVMLLILGAEGESGGAANQAFPLRAESMFSVTATRVTRFLTPAHELGHNMGCIHDRGCDNKCDQTTSINHGWRDPDGDFRTIMACTCAPDQCDDYEGTGSCIRVKYFAGPRQVNGKPLGDAQNDCGAVITNNKAAFAALLPTVTPSSPTNPPTPSPTSPPAPGGSSPTPDDPDSGGCFAPDLRAIQTFGCCCAQIRAALGRTFSMLGSD